MQGLPRLVDTNEKVRYLEKLMLCGFHTLDCGSFVSPAAVPQMADTADVISSLSDAAMENQLLVIVANERGAKEAASYPSIDYLGFPFSVSETFQRRNTNTGREKAFERLLAIRQIAVEAGKECVVYLSMGFGNPYNEPYDRDETLLWATKMVDSGFRYISLSDTVGAANPEDVKFLFDTLVNAHPEIVFGAHFHSSPGAWKPKIDAALAGGCRRFDGALRGFGGCPFAKDDLTGNLPTEELIHYFHALGFETGVDPKALHEALLQASVVFG
jgi:hydroxymethylglutaryl-CoA lyase